MNKLSLSNLLSRKHGFTVVELVVVIAIIGILATIILVAYPGYQTKIQNDTRRSDLAQVSAALKAYAQRNNDYIEAGSGCGSSGAGSGWLNLSNYGTGYGDSIIDCLKAEGFLDESKSYADPSGCLTTSVGCKSEGSGYMKKNCSLNGRKAVYLLAYLVGEPPQDDLIDTKLCDTNMGYAKYKMNYYVKVN